ncbi:MAG TPA: hypothetical protein VNL17_09885 [Verrucomicrobiae bacterium]|nr:hypothetical protein [Verrucomicrobiae bacterium]
MTENQIVRQLHGIAGKLTPDPVVHMDLMQEMFVHLVQIQTAEAGQTLSWYLKSCEFHARNYLERIRNGAPNEKAPAAGNSEPRGDSASHSSTTVAIEIQGELITNETANRIIPRLSDKQQQILFLLMKGCGVRETGREVGITHPAVIKHRKKIARIAHELLQESAGAAVSRHNGTNGNGNGEGHAA